MQEMQVRSLNQERYPAEGNGNSLQCLVWDIPQIEEPGGLQDHGVANYQMGIDFL